LELGEREREKREKDVERWSLRIEAREREAVEDVGKKEGGATCSSSSSSEAKEAAPEGEAAKRKSKEKNITESMAADWLAALLSGTLSPTAKRKRS
jgi:hypothetical protein